MKKIIWVLIVLIVIVGVVAWYFAAMSQPAVAPSAPSGISTSTAVAPVSATATTTASSSPVNTFMPSAYFNSRATATLGMYLTDAKGMTLYTFTHDTTDKSNCTGVCLTKWFPYGPGISASGTYNLPMLTVNVGVIKGNNGMAQFTWKGMPLYFYYQDKTPGQTLGEGVLGAWYVVKL